MNTYTEGPWTVEQDDDGSCGIVSPDSKYLAFTAGAKDTEAELLNARLIAAAPDLLAALEAVLRWARTSGTGDSELVSAALTAKEFTHARGAIAKAKGEA